MANHIVSVDCYDIEKSIHQTFNQDDCKFGYKSSIFAKQPGKFIILGTLIKISKSGVDRSSVIKKRRSKMPYPKNLPKTISPFMSPVLSKQRVNQLKANFPKLETAMIENDSFYVNTGQLIEMINLNGYCDGNFCSFSLHDIVITHNGRGSRAEYERFVGYITKYVKELSGIDLRVRSV